MLLTKSLVRGLITAFEPLGGSCALKGKYFLLDRVFFLDNNDCTALSSNGTAILRFNPASTTYEIQQVE